MDLLMAITIVISTARRYYQQHTIKLLEHLQLYLLSSL